MQKGDVLVQVNPTSYITLRQVMYPSSTAGPQRLQKRQIRIIKPLQGPADALCMS